MTVRSTLICAVERSEEELKQHAERYAIGANQVVERVAKTLAKLPAGDKLAGHYSELAGKMIQHQRGAAKTFVERQAQVQAWPLRLNLQKEST